MPTRYSPFYKQDALCETWSKTHILLISFISVIVEKEISYYDDIEITINKYGLIPTAMRKLDWLTQDMGCYLICITGNGTRTCPVARDINAQQNLYSHCCKEICLND
jgi:hypothetical protein